MTRWMMMLLILLTMAAQALADGQTPTLDELLNLPTSKPATQPAKTQAESDHASSAQQASDAFEQAVTEMRQAADKLGQHRDAGLSTQRLQEQILARLDQVIAAARRQQSQPSSSSSGSSSSSSSSSSSTDDAAKNNATQRGDPSAAKTAAQASGQSPAGLGDNRGQIPNPDSAQQGDAAGGVRNDAASWGNLPPRLRDQLQQGQEERFSPVYQELTEAYYRRLAEQSQ
ncbi:MAG: hypothetical protein IT440_14420 [Phycisphaeraceae bacterium]|nr:hypothetical protein [Phycisphaeraceae bacterium]